jgi:hypothetical protein
VGVFIELSTAQVYDGDKVRIYLHMYIVHQKQF